MVEKSKFFSAEKAGVVLDIGIAYTKIGFLNENIPRKILITPKNLFKSIKQLKIDKKDSLYLSPAEMKEFKFEMEAFLNIILFNELLVSPKERSIFICENFLTPRTIINIIGEILFKCLECQKVYFLFSNSLPLYTSGLFTGIVIESGFYETQITPIYEGFPMLHCFEFCEAGGLIISKEMKRQLIEENKDNSAFKRKIPDFEMIENLKFKFLFIPLKNQSDEYLSKEENIQKMKKTIYDYQAEAKEIVKISYFTRFTCGNLLFGDSECEPNIAASLLRSIKKIDKTSQKKIIQNLILSGGNVHIKNFAKRLKQEIVELIDKSEEFASLKILKDFFAFTNIVYPPNCLNFIGAAMIGSMIGCEQFAITNKNYFDKYESEIPDRIFREYLNNYLQNKSEKNEKKEKMEKSQKLEKNEDMFNSASIEALKKISTSNF